MCHVEIVLYPVQQHRQRQPHKLERIHHQYLRLQAPSTTTTTSGELPLPLLLQQQHHLARSYSERRVHCARVLDCPASKHTLSYVVDQMIVQIRLMIHIVHNSMIHTWIY